VRVCSRASPLSPGNIKSPTESSTTTVQLGAPPALLNTQLTAGAPTSTMVSGPACAAEAAAKHPAAAMLAAAIAIFIVICPSQTIRCAQP